jgi:ribonuclease P protein component
MLDNTLSRAERLRSLSAIRRLFGEGKSGFVYPFRYNFLIHTDAPSAADEQTTSSSEYVKVMFSVPKRFHKRANKRNLLKRRSREAYRLNRTSLVESLSSRGLRVELALVYSTKESHSYKTIEYAVQRVLEQVIKRS